jgi:DNA invertase Pin-like site-specific DNA recombinase
MKAIYTRISTSRQTPDIQLLTKGDFYYNDTCSGSISFMERPKAKELIANDKITSIEIREVSRIGRNTADVLKTLEYFNEKKINIYIQNIGLNTIIEGKVNPIANLIISIFGSIAQQERELLIERVNAGVQIAKAQGKYKGRKKGTIENFKVKYKEQIPKIKELLNKGVSKTDIAILHNISRVTLNEIIKRTM